MTSHSCTRRYQLLRRRRLRRHSLCLPALEAGTKISSMLPLVGIPRMETGEEEVDIVGVAVAESSRPFRCGG